MLFLGLIIPIIAFFFESYPRWISRNVGVDVWTHLLYLKEYHKHGKIPGYISEGFIVGGEYDYPPAFIAILSKFPLKLVKKYEFLFSPFFDSLHIIFIFGITYLITGSILFAILTQLLYILTPIIVVENSSATPRSLGYTLFSVTFICLFYFQEAGIYWLFLIALATGTLIFLSHRFTAQGYLFFSIAFSILTNDIIFLLAFVASFLLAIIVSKGFYLKVLRGHIGNLSFWHKVIKHRFSHQIRGNVKSEKSSDIVTNIYQEFLKFPPFVLTITNPWLLPAFGTLFLASHSQIELRLLEWTIISYILALLITWIEKLRFLGEGQRYLELSAFPASFLAVLFLFRNLNYLGIVLPALYIVAGLLAILTIIVIQYKAIIKKSFRTLTPELKNMFKYIKALRTKPRIMCIPHQITTNTIYHTGANVLVNANYKDINKISDIYPYIQKPISKIAEKYNLTHVLINEDYVKLEELKLNDYVIEKQVGEIKLIKLK